MVICFKIADDLLEKMPLQKQINMSNIMPIEKNILKIDFGGFAIEMNPICILNMQNKMNSQNKQVMPKQEFSITKILQQVPNIESSFATKTDGSFYQIFPFENFDKPQYQTDIFHQKLAVRFFDFIEERGIRILWQKSEFSQGGWINKTAIEEFTENGKHNIRKISVYFQGNPPE